MSGGGYPMGAQYDPRAPYNRRENDDMEFPVRVEVTLSRKDAVSTTNYELDIDDDGTHSYDVTQQELEDKYHGYTSIVDCLNALKERLEKELADPDCKGDMMWKLKDLLDTCQGWEITDLYIEREE